MYRDCWFTSLTHASMVSLAICLAVLNGVVSQGAYEYYMDSHAECGKMFEIGESSARIVGHGSVQSSSSPTECTITLSTDALKEQRVFSVEIGSAQITDQDVTFYVYDGQSKDSRPLDSFSYNKAPGPNYRPLITSGGFVTFYLRKQSPQNFGYNINAFVTSIPGNVPNPDQCENGQGYGCQSFYTYNPLVTKEQITYIVAGCFGVVVLIIPVVVIYCYCRQKGVTRRWDEYKLDGIGNTAASINGSAAPTSVKEPWSSQTSRQPYSSRRSQGRSRKSNPSYSEGSITDDDIPPKNAAPPPPPYSEFDYRRDHRGRDRRYDYDNRYDDDRSDRYEREERRYNANGRRPRDRYGDAAENSYVQADDDHPQEKFVERIIKPRVQPKSAGRVRKGRVDDDEENDMYDSIEDTKKVLNRSDSEAEKTDREVQVEEDSESDENPQTESEYQTSEEESESEEEKGKGKDPRHDLYAKPNKAKKGSSKPDKPKEKKQKQHQQAPAPAAAVGQVPVSQPGVLPVPGMIRHPLQPGFTPAGVPFRPVGPIGPRPLPPGVVRPVFTAPNQFQRVPGNPNQFNPANPVQLHPARYQQPPRPPGLVNPGQGHPGMIHPGQGHSGLVNLPQGRPLQPQNAPAPPTNPPVPRQREISTNSAPMFSHLVQRGYDPNVTGRHSPVSSIGTRSHHSGVLRLDDSSGGPNLGSGVELMKRTTDV